MTLRYYLGMLLSMWLLLSCEKDNAMDTEVPVIHLEASETFPQQCAVLKRNETFEFQFTFSDNVALGSFSLDIHHNFDQHTHSTELSSCDFQPKKDPVNPFVFIQDYTIPSGSTSYKAKVSVTIPPDVDTGDYHLMIKLTDQEGWSTLKGLSITIT